MAVGELGIREVAINSGYRSARRLIGKAVPARVKERLKTADLRQLSTEELLSLMRHESHRIEKAVYNDILASKNDVYRAKRDRLSSIYVELDRRGIPADEATIVWSRQIYDAFDDLDETFIQPNSTPLPTPDPSRADAFVNLVSARRSVRVWADQQPSVDELMVVADAMMDAARWAPTSGNRQPWRFCSDRRRS